MKNVRVLQSYYCVISSKNNNCVNDANLYQYVVRTIECKIHEL